MQAAARFVSLPDRIAYAKAVADLYLGSRRAPVVAARIYVKAGSLTEGKWMGAGLSHVLEHLVAGASSAKRKESESAELLKSIGNDSNAFTSDDLTVYHILAGNAALPKIIEIESDRFQRLQYEDAKFQSWQAEYGFTAIQVHCTASPDELVRRFSDRPQDTLAVAVRHRSWPACSGCARR